MLELIHSSPFFELTALLALAAAVIGFAIGVGRHGSRIAARPRDRGTDVALLPFADAADRAFDRLIGF